MSQSMLTASISKASGVDLALPETADGAAYMGYDSMAGGAPAGVAPTENMMFATCNVLPGGGRRDGAEGNEMDTTGEADMSGDDDGVEKAASCDKMLGMYGDSMQLAAGGHITMLKGGGASRRVIDSAPAHT